jgi:O-antigen/teichoic acid export membrane protein
VVDSKKGYKTAFKATGLFGGVQVITIIIGVINSKCVAIWLGPSGLGLLSLFKTVTQLVFSISNLGLSNSAIREISLKQMEENKEVSLPTLISSLNKWVLFTGIIGTLLMILFAKSLSIWIVGSEKYTLSFVLVSVVVLFTALYNGHYAILQGFRELNSMAKARIFGVLYGTLFTLPLYYYFHEKGIVVGLVLSALITCLTSKYYVNKMHLILVNVNVREAFIVGKPAVKLGIMMAISAIAVSIVEFIVKSFIVRSGGVEDVGFYQAGWTINVAYLGLVFTAMATDYFPRLSQSSGVRQELYRKINEQAEIAILILGPMIAVMLIFLPLIIRLLYTNEFVEIIPMTKWLLIGSLVKAGSWAISFVFLAKGDGKKFLFNELGIKLITLPSYILGYYYCGLIGIGYAFIFNYSVYFFVVSIVAYRIYFLKLGKPFWIIFFILLSVLVSYVFLESYFGVNWIVQVVYLLLILCYSVFEINNRIDLLPF